MEGIEFKLNYGGSPVDVTVYEEENCIGTLHPIEMDGIYVFTLYQDEEQNWQVMKEQDGRVPYVDPQLQKDILRKLRNKLRDAA